MLAVDGFRNKADAKPWMFGIGGFEPPKPPYFDTADLKDAKALLDELA